MWDIFLKTVPFFAIIGLGYASGRTKFFTAEATAYLTKFVFYFALSAMLFRFSAAMSRVAAIWGNAAVSMARSYSSKRRARATAASRSRCLSPTSGIGPRKGGSHQGRFRPLRPEGSVGGVALCTGAL